MLHELWDEPGVGQTFVLAGPRGDAARADLTAGAQLVWTVEASSHFDAMTAYYLHEGLGKYPTDFPEVDRRTYASLGWE